MALGFYFTPSGFTPEKYDEAIRQLDAAGAGAPAGRSYHFALESDGAIQVFDIWESQAAFEAFGPTLVPILSGLGVEPGEPMVARVRNVIPG
jgi:hypothetical protein